MLLVSIGGTGNYIHRTHHLSWFGGGLNLGARGEGGIGIERKRGIRV